MTQRRKAPSVPEAPAMAYLAQAKALSQREIDALRQRMQGRFERRIEDKRKSSFEILALQLEFEDSQLNDWRSAVTKIRQNKVPPNAALSHGVGPATSSRLTEARAQ